MKGWDGEYHVLEHGGLKYGEIARSLGFPHSWGPHYLLRLFMMSTATPAHSLFGEIRGRDDRFGAGAWVPYVALPRPESVWYKICGH